MRQDISRRAYDDALLIWEWREVEGVQRWIIVAVRPRVKDQK